MYAMMNGVINRVGKKMTKLYRRYLDWYLYRQEECLDYKWEWPYEFMCWASRFFLCLFIFHEPMDDQCGKPEHRFCFKCGRETPNAKVRY